MINKRKFKLLFLILVVFSISISCFADRGIRGKKSRPIRDKKSRPTRVGGNFELTFTRTCPEKPNWQMIPNTTCRTSTLDGQDTQMCIKPPSLYNFDKGEYKRAEGYFYCYYTWSWTTSSPTMFVTNQHPGTRAWAYRVSVPPGRKCRVQGRTITCI